MIARSSTFTSEPIKSFFVSQHTHVKTLHKIGPRMVPCFTMLSTSNILVSPNEVKILNFVCSLNLHTR